SGATAKVGPRARTNHSNAFYSWQIVKIGRFTRINGSTSIPGGDVSGRRFAGVYNAEISYKGPSRNDVDRSIANAAYTYPRSLISPQGIYCCVERSSALVLRRVDRKLGFFSGGIHRLRHPIHVPDGTPHQ